MGNRLQKINRKNHEIILSSRVLEIKKEKDNYYVVTTEGGKEFIAKNIFISMPLAHLPKTIKPAPSESVFKSWRKFKI